MTTRHQRPYGEVYVITCALNGKQYVGQTTRGTMARWAQHKACVVKPKYPLHRSLMAYGVDNFSLAVVDTATTQEELDAKEIHWIATLMTLSPNGYNLTTGGEGGKRTQETKDKLAVLGAMRKHTLDSKKKIGESSKGRNVGSKRSDETKALMRESWNRTPEGAERIRQVHLGKTHTPEAKALMSAKAKARWAELAIDDPRRKQSTELIEKRCAAHLGSKRSEEAKARMSAAAKTRPPVSPETREKMSASRKGKAHSPETRAKMVESRKSRK